jgi:hypothetical protein
MIGRMVYGVTKKSKKRICSLHNYIHEEKGKVGLRRTANRQGASVWRLAFGVWRLAFGVWRLAFGVWRLAFEPIVKKGAQLQAQFKFFS